MPPAKTLAGIWKLVAGNFHSKKPMILFDTVLGFQVIVDEAHEGTPKLTLEKCLEWIKAKKY